MNSETLFSMALGLHAPWQVKDVTFSTDELAHSELHLHIDLYRAHASWMKQMSFVLYTIPSSGSGNI